MEDPTPELPLSAKEPDRNIGADPRLAREVAVKRKPLWAGVDVGVETASVCIIDGAGEVIHEGVCPTLTKHVRHELTTFRRNRFASVALEAGTGTHIARALRSLGYPVELYETRQLSKFLRVRRNKIDAGDAKGNCRSRPNKCLARIQGLPKISGKPVAKPGLPNFRT